MSGERARDEGLNIIEPLHSVQVSYDRFDEGPLVANYGYSPQTLHRSAPLPEVVDSIRPVQRPQVIAYYEDIVDGIHYQVPHYDNGVLGDPVPVHRPSQTPRSATVTSLGAGDVSHAGFSFSIREHNGAYSGEFSNAAPEQKERVAQFLGHSTESASVKIDATGGSKIGRERRQADSQRVALFGSKLARVVLGAGVTLLVLWGLDNAGNAVEVAVSNKISFGKDDTWKLNKDPFIFFEDAWRIVP